VTGERDARRWQEAATAVPALARFSTVEESSRATSGSA